MWFSPIGPQQNNGIGNNGIGPHVIQNYTPNSPRARGIAGRDAAEGGGAPDAVRILAEHFTLTCFV